MMKSARNTAFSGVVGLFNYCFQPGQTKMSVDNCINIGNNPIIKEKSA